MGDPGSSREKPEAAEVSGALARVALVRAIPPEDPVLAAVRTQPSAAPPWVPRWLEREVVAVDAGLLRLLRACAEREGAFAELRLLCGLSGADAGSGPTAGTGQGAQAEACRRIQRLLFWDAFGANLRAWIEEDAPDATLSILAADAALAEWIAAAAMLPDEIAEALTRAQLHASAERLRLRSAPDAQPCRGTLIAPLKLALEYLGHPDDRIDQTLAAAGPRLGRGQFR